MRLSRILLKIGIIIVAGVTVVLFMPRPSPSPVAALTAAPAGTTAPAIEAPVMISASAMRITIASVQSAARTALAGRIDPAAAESGVLDTEAAASVQTAIDLLLAEGSAEILARPAIMVLSGQPARIVIGSVPVAGASPPTRQSLEVDVLATTYADGAADLKAIVVRKDVSGELSVFLDDLGVPVGERRARGDLHLPPGSRAYLVRSLSDGSFLLVLLDLKVQLPAPSAPQPTPGG